MYRRNNSGRRPIRRNRTRFMRRKYLPIEEIEDVIRRSGPEWDDLIDEMDRGDYWTDLLEAAKLIENAYASNAPNAMQNAIDAYLAAGLDRENDPDGNVAHFMSVALEELGSPELANQVIEWWDHAVRFIELENEEVPFNPLP